MQAAPLSEENVGQQGQRADLVQDTDAGPQRRGITGESHAGVEETGIE